MFDIFEQPWTLLTAAIVILFVTLILRRIFPQRQRWWQLLLPILLAVAAFGFDFLVQTDLEKINALINTGIKAVEEENPDEIEAIISDNYRDSYHNTKEDLMYYCRALLSQPLVERNKKMALTIEKSPPKATATLTAVTHFDKQSNIYGFKRLMLTKIKLDLQKEQKKNGLSAALKYSKSTDSR